jgi:hypothetical protein
VVTVMPARISRRRFLETGILAGAGMTFLPASPRKTARALSGALTGEMPMPAQTLAMETYARRAFNYLDRMIDKNGLPYFNIFWTHPAEAAHDWPDFGDVLARQLQGAVMARHMTGQEAAWEKRWVAKLLGYLDPGSGLLRRPKTTYNPSVTDPGDQALTLYALVTVYLDSGDRVVRSAIQEMVAAIRRDLAAQGKKSPYLSGFLIKSLMAAARALGEEASFDAAGVITRFVFDESEVFAPDNHFRHGGHMHGNLRTLVGAADYSLQARDPELFSRVDALYHYVRSETTRFGFLPEQIGRKSDVVLCETCALMDYLGLASTLANHGHPEYWDDVERMARNQLLESQFADASWLDDGPGGPVRADTAQFTVREVGARMIGAYAGWSSPTHFLAVRETLNHHWGGPELRDKTRVFQNCCAGSGTHALYTVWKNAARFNAGRLSVHLHIDKLLPEAEIRCRQPYQGLLSVALKKDAAVRVRIPGFAKPAELKADLGREDRKLEPKIVGNYLEFEGRRAGETLRVFYPLPVRSEDAAIGNPGFKSYGYAVTWKGDTVVAMEPKGGQYKTGYSDFDEREVPIYYGTDGPGPIYQRESMRADAVPEPAELHEDDGRIDFWKLR